MSRTMANRPCEDDYAALEQTFARLREVYAGATLADAVAFMQYAATSQLNKNFVVFTRDYRAGGC